MGANALSYAAVIDVIKLINVLLGKKVIPESEYLFKKVTTEGISHQLHFFCKDCSHYYGKQDETISKTTCTICDGGRKDYFVYNNVTPALRKIYNSNYSDIKKHQDAMKNTDCSIVSDVNNGQWHRSNNDFNNGNFISLNINTDGVQPYSSSQLKSMWPVLLVLNDLPMHLRFMKKNVIVAGYWFSSTPVDIDMFFRPLLLELNELYHIGMSTIGGKIIKVLIANVCLDSVARPKILKTKQFNGAFGCSLCLHQASGQVYEYVPYNRVEMRTKQHYLDCCAQLEQMQSNRKTSDVKGIKGKSILFDLEYFDPIIQCQPDPMHNLFLGCTKQLLSIWLNKKNKGCDFHLSKEKVTMIDQRLYEIKTYSECSRVPRSISDFSNYKASELFNWLFIYARYCLIGTVLTGEYYRHFYAFVDCCEQLYSGGISLQNINDVEKKLFRFVKDFQRLYGVQNMTFNVHLLTHISETVRQFGSLASVSLFPFENMNGILGSFLKGPKGPLIQLSVRQYLFFSNYYNSLRLNALATNFVRQIVQRQSSTMKRTNENRRYQMFAFNEKVYKSYAKFYHRGIIITTNENSQKSKFYQDCFIYYKNKFYIIDKILVEVANENNLFILGREILTYQTALLPNHYGCIEYKQRELIRLEDCISKCFRFQHNNRTESLSIIKNLLITD